MDSTLISSEEASIRLIQTAKAKSGKGWDEIAMLVNKAYGSSYSGNTLANRVNYGKVKFSLALEVFSVLNIETLSIPTLREKLESK